MPMFISNSRSDQSIQQWVNKFLSLTWTLVTHFGCQVLNIKQWLTKSLVHLIVDIVNHITLGFTYFHAPVHPHFEQSIEQWATEGLVYLTLENYRFLVLDDVNQSLVWHILRFLSNPNSDLSIKQWATEGLAYLTIDADNTLLVQNILIIYSIYMYNLIFPGSCPTRPRTCPSSSGQRKAWRTSPWTRMWRRS